MALPVTAAAINMTNVRTLMNGGRPVDPARVLILGSSGRLALKVEDGDDWSLANIGHVGPVARLDSIRVVWWWPMVARE
jgi:hypothetical protein